MKFRINLFLANALIVTLTLTFSTCLFLAQIRDGALHLAKNESEFLTAYSQLKFNIIAGSVVIGILFIALGFVLLRERNRYGGLLRESEQKYREMADQIRLITDSVPVSISYVDANLRYRFANRRYKELFGLADGEPVGRSVRDIVGEAFFAAREENIRQTLAGHEITFSNKMTRSDGGTLHLQTSYIPHWSAAGVVVGYFIQHHDITDLTLAQEALRASEKRYRTMFCTTGTATFIIEEDTTVSLVNKEFTRLSGYCPEEVEGKLSWTSFVNPANRERMLAYHQARRDGSATVPSVYECDVLRKDGAIRPILAHVNLIPGTSQSIASFLDISEYKELHEALRNQLAFLQTLIDTIPSPIFYKDRGGRYLGYNQAFEESMGLKRDQLIGKTVYDVAPQELADKYHEMDEELFTNQGNQVYESSVVYADGIRHDVIFNKATFTDSDGGVGGLVGVILDVTERKKAEDSLAEREEFLSDIIDGIQDGISILDADLRIIRVNPVMERWGFDGLPLVGRKCHEAYHGRTEPCEQCPSLETLRTGKPSLKIFPMTEKGTERKSWLELHTFPLYDSKKSQVMGVIEYLRDITEHKRADDALIAAENKFRSLVEQSLTGIYIIQDGGFVYVNPKMAEIFGYTQDEFTSGITHLDLTVEYDRPLAAENVRRRIAGEVQSVHYGFRGLRKDGTTINAEAYGSGTQFNGRPAIIGTLLDVTARKRAEDALMESEERFHQIFAQNLDAIILFRIDDLSIIDANPKAEELTGFTRSELKRFTPTSILAPEDFRSLMDSMPIDDHSLGFQLDRGVCTRKDGSTTYVSIWSKIIMLRDKSAVYLSIRDITDKIRLQEEIRATQAKLIHANKMTSLGMLASSIAHEINNPNSYISVNTAMLADVWRDATPILMRHLDEHGDFPLGGLPFSEMEVLAPRLFNGIAEGSRRINAIVTNMKNYVKHDGASPDVEFDLNVAVQDAATILWHHIHKHSDNFILSLADDLPPARGSRQQIEQVVINLITNALQALPDKNSGVSVETGFDRNAGALTIAVRDKGKGMSEKVLQRLTEPFFTTRSGDGGTGLGLYISASIVKEHKGALEFNSLPGSGTTVTIRLPMAGRAF